MLPGNGGGCQQDTLDMEDVVALIDARAAKPNRPAVYKKAEPDEISN